MRPEQLAAFELQLLPVLEQGLFGPGLAFGSYFVPFHASPYEEAASGA